MKTKNRFKLLIATALIFTVASCSLDYDPISEYSRGIEDENMLIILNKDKILTNSNFFDLPDKAAIAGFKLYETPFMRNAVFQKRIFNRTFCYINNADLQ